jgi:type I restriction enzyme S subunit
VTLVNDWLNRLPSHWDFVPLRSVAALGTGHTPDRTKPEYWVDCDIPWVTAADLSRRTSEFTPLEDTLQKVSALGVANSAAVVHPGATVMFCRTASVGLLTIIGKPMATTQAFATWTAGPLLLPRYLLYVLAAMRPELFRLAYGSTHLTIYMPDLEALKIPLPPLQEQNRIVEFLDAQVGLMERAASAQAREKRLLLERFRARLAEETLLPQDSPNVQRARVKYLFEFERNGIWGSDADGGKDDVPCVRVADFDRKRFTAAEAPTIRSVPLGQRLPRLLKRGDVLLEKSGGTPDKPVGCAVTYMSDEPAVCSNFVATLRPASDVVPRFAGLLLAALYQTRRNGPFVNQTTGIQNLDSSAYLAREVWVPHYGAQEAIVRRVEDEGDRAEQLMALADRRVGLLQERKQTLVTAAVTGQFDVSTAKAA